MSADTAQLRHMSPGSQGIAFIGPAGLSTIIGYQGNLALSGYVGCRLSKSRLGG